MNRWLIAAALGLTVATARVDANWWCGPNNPYPGYGYPGWFWTPELAAFNGYGPPYALWQVVPVQVEAVQACVVDQVRPVTCARVNFRKEVVRRQVRELVPERTQVMQDFVEYEPVQTSRPQQVATWSWKLSASFDPVCCQVRYCYVPKVDVREVQVPCVEYRAKQVRRAVDTVRYVERVREVEETCVVPELTLVKSWTVQRTVQATPTLATLPVAAFVPPPYYYPAYNFEYP